MVVVPLRDMVLLRAHYRQDDATTETGIAVRFKMCHSQPPVNLL